MACKITWTNEAKVSLGSILEFWTKHNQSKEYAVKILKEIRKTEGLLSNAPEIGRRCFRKDVEVRAISILKKFTLFYKIYEERVTIVAFISNAILTQIDEFNIR